MPSSSAEGKAWAAGQIADLAPKRVLDIGPGVGTYVDLARPLLRDSHWTGLEIYEPYVERYKLGDKYDAVLVGDVCSFDWGSEWDLVIFGDVLEHLELADAIEVWRSARGRSKHVLASVPIVEHPQGECEGNVHETHRVTFDHGGVMAAFAGIDRYWIGRRIGMYMAPGDAAGRPPAARVRHATANARRSRARTG